jgi:hypothetical protein
MLSYPRSSPRSHLHCRRLSTRSICLDLISHFNRTATTDDRLALVLIRILAVHRKRRISQTSTATGNQELACSTSTSTSTTQQHATVSYIQSANRYSIIGFIGLSIIRFVGLFLLGFLRFLRFGRSGFGSRFFF